MTRRDVRQGRYEDQRRRASNPVTVTVTHADLPEGIALALERDLVAFLRSHRLEFSGSDGYRVLRAGIVVSQVEVAPCFSEPSRDLGDSELLELVRALASLAPFRSRSSPMLARHALVFAARRDMALSPHGLGSAAGQAGYEARNWRTVLGRLVGRGQARQLGYGRYTASLQDLAGDEFG